MHDIGRLGLLKSYPTEMTTVLSGQYTDTQAVRAGGAHYRPRVRRLLADWPLGLAERLFRSLQAPSRRSERKRFRYPPTGQSSMQHRRCDRICGRQVPAAALLLGSCVTPEVETGTTSRAPGRRLAPQRDRQTGSLRKLIRAKTRS